MNPGEVMVVLIVLIAVVGSVYRAKLRAGAQQPDLPVRDADAERLRDEVRQLRERVRVLERVITDTHSSRDLDVQIERLRDPR